MKNQGLSLRGTLFLITIGTGAGSLLPVIAGLQQLTVHWWLGLYALLLACTLRILYAPVHNDSVEEGQ